MGGKLSQNYIYLIGSDDGPLKVGVSVNPGSRVRTLQGAHPHELRVMQTWRSDHARAIETAAHIALREFRVRGEWFNTTEDVARSLIERLMNQKAVALPDSRIGGVPKRPWKRTVRFKPTHSPISSYTDVINQFPSRAILAATIGIPQSTIRAWRSRDSIPASYFGLIAVAGRKLGVSVSASQLWSVFNRRAQEPAWNRIEAQRTQPTLTPIGETGFPQLLPDKYEQVRRDDTRDRRNDLSEKIGGGNSPPDQRIASYTTDDKPGNEE